MTKLLSMANLDCCSQQCFVTTVQLCCTMLVALLRLGTL
jgi:hypothetical protein